MIGGRGRSKHSIATSRTIILVFILMLLLQFIPLAQCNFQGEKV